MPHAPRCGAKLEHVSRLALHSKIGVERANAGADFGHDTVLGLLGNRATGCNGCNTRSAPSTQAVIAAIAMQICSAANSRRDPVAEHGNDVIKILARERMKRPGLPAQFEKIILLPVLAGHRGD